jgi:alpha-galactosidase
VLDEELDITGVSREEIKINVLGVNHFTWLTEAKYADIDLFPVYHNFIIKHYTKGYHKQSDENWMNKYFDCKERVKMDLF